MRMSAPKSALVALAASFLAVGCDKDPNDPQTWVDKLGDRQAQNEALHRLERMADPLTLKPLAEAWKKQNKASPILRVIINIASTKDPKTGKANFTPETLEVLKDAVDGYDGASSRSIDDAVVSCDALGRAGDPAAVPVMITAATKALPKTHPGTKVRIACTRALGNFHDPRVADVLVRILETDPEKDKQEIRLNAAAALALAESGDAKALPALINAMYFTPVIFQQVRQAVTRVGKPAIPDLMRLFQEKDPDVAAKAKEKGFDKSAPGNIQYKAALLLGDMRVKEAVPALTAALRTEPRVAFTDKAGAAGAMTHDGILGALRLIADPSAASAVKAYWADPKTYDGTRPTAIDVYSMISADDSGLPDLMKFIRDEKEEQPIRLASVIAYGRLARTKAAEDALAEMARHYDARFKKADERAKAAAGKADAQLDEERQVSAYWRDALNESVQRIKIAVECNKDPACYAKALPPTVKEFKAGSPNLARAERALLEIAKLGEGARGQTDALLAGADVTERFVRQAILLALPRVAALPCAKCAERLDQVIDKQSQTTTLDFLTGETRIVYHYFLWAGK